ncbi:ADYC domain-containing protein [Sorangium cellulosum]|nr:ADYC domain-containing protein [Sorangium cellulosum]
MLDLPRARRRRCGWGGTPIARHGARRGPAREARRERRMSKREVRFMMTLFTGSRVETRRAGVCGAAGGASQLRRAGRAAVVALRGAALLLGAACVGEEPADELSLVDEAGSPASEAQVVEIDVELDVTIVPPSLKACVSCMEFNDILSADELRNRWGQQGRTLHGIMDGGDCEAMEVPRSFSLSSAADAAGAHIPDVQVHQGRLVSSSGAVEWKGARFQASVRCAGGAGTLPVTAVITEVLPGASHFERAYRLDKYRVMLIDPRSGASFPACRNPEDRTRGHLAIALPGVWNEHGNLEHDLDAFTFACVTSAAAKCDDWGYGHAGIRAVDVSEMRVHEACTRMARADYCGTGGTWTRDSTTIGFWDSATVAGAEEAYPPQAPGFEFEAAWTAEGALCMHHPRWPDRSPMCEKEIPFCDSAKQASDRFDKSLLLFNTSRTEGNTIGLPRTMPRTMPIDP